MLLIPTCFEGGNNVYKVRCRLARFEGDPENFPCHFHYKLGDEIWYDGDKITGSICPHILLPMMPMIYGMHTLGNNFAKSMPFRYRGMDVPGPEMVKYDGQGWKPRREFPKELMSKQTSVFPMQSKTDKAKGAHFICPDTRTLAHFAVEAVDLSDAPFCEPFYRRAMAVLYKVEAEPGIAADAILGSFTEFARDEVSPPLTPVFVEVLLEALEDMGYVTIAEGKVTATGKEPPSRPELNY